MRIVKSCTVKSLFATLFAAVACLGVLTTAHAVPLQKDVHYQLINPALSTEVSGKIEVIEFFSYGCSHCYQFEPSINPWIKKLPKDVNFYRVPLAGGAWASTAKLFYTLDAMGVEDKLHGEVFTAIHADKTMNPGDEATIIAWAAKKGLDQNKFSEIYKSFSVQTKVQRAVQLAASHKVDGVPTLVVDGRYVVLKNTIQSFDDLTGLTDQVIEMARTTKK